MPIYTVPDDFDVPDSFKAYTPEDTDGLKNTANKLLTESKGKDITIAEHIVTIKKLKVDLNSGATGDAKKIQSQLDDALSKNTELKSTNESMVKAHSQDKVKGEASRLAAGLTKDTRKAAMLAKEIGARLSLDSDKGFTVLDASGNPTISSTEELMSQVKSDFNFLVDGSQATGGGAQGGSGGAADTKTMKRADFDKLDNAARHKFSVADKGTVVDD